jgi:hypothetical protein
MKDAFKRAQRSRGWAACPCRHCNCHVDPSRELWNQQARSRMHQEDRESWRDAVWQSDEIHPAEVRLLEAEAAER